MSPLYSRLVKVREHGSMFYYKCAATAVLAWVCERAAKRRFADLLSEFVWSKLGAERDAEFICDVNGQTVPSAGMSVTLRDFARWGQLYLAGGHWQGQSARTADQRHRKDEVVGRDLL